MSNKTYELTRWSLEDLYPGHDAPEFEAAREMLDASIAEFEKHRDKLSADMDPEAFMDMVQEMETMMRQANRVYGFASLWFSEDTQDQEAQNLMPRIQQFFAGLQNRTLFFELWWKSLDDDQAAHFMQYGADFEYYLEQLRNFKPHTLSEPEEKIINLKDVTGSSAIQLLYSSITNRYVYKVEVEGEVKELTRGELMALVQTSDPDLRARAYQELYKVYGDDGAILGQMYQALVRDWRNENVDLRKFSSPIAVRNLANDIPDEVVETLMGVAEKNAPVFQRFFKLKAKLLGVEKLRRYDIYAPVTQAEKKYDWQTAVDLTLESFRDFQPRIAELAQRVLDEDHLDSEVRKGKSGGAFCATIEPDLTPWVLVNYNGQARDVGTLAHELGHAIHSMLADHHNTFTQGSSLPMAETASTFAEMLLIDRLLAEETDEDVRRDILFAQVDDNFATILRQIFFALFERQAHQMVHEGASVEELSDAYMENLKTQFGDSVEISEEFRWEWVSIPHIYQVPFYVYAYAFGQLLVLALYQQYKKEGASFKARYIEILAAGGSDAPVRVLSKAGIDVTKAEFWQGGFDMIAEMVDQLEELTGE